MEAEKTKIRTKKFLDELGVPVTVFCRKVGISPTAYRDWQKNDLKLSDITVNRISNYLLKYGF